MIVALVIKAGVIPGISPSIDNNKNTIKENELNAITITGTIYDAKGKKLAWNDEIDDARKYVDPFLYSSLFAFESGGLQNIYHSELNTHGDNKYKDENGETYYRGSNLHLTIRHDLQEKVHQLLHDYDNASVVILDENGAVECMTSTKGFDIYKIRDNYDELSNKEAALLNPAKDYSVPCGSVLKPIVAQAIREYGYDQSFIVDDQGQINVGGSIIHNAGGSEYGKIGLETALVKSSNVYFISAGQYLGKNIIEDRFTEFLIGHSIKTDFGKINSSCISIEDDYDLAMCIMGQDVGISTVHLAMITQGITTGKIKKPYMVSKIESDDKLVEKTKADVIATTSVESEDIKAVNEVMAGCAESYGLDSEYAGTSVLAKTGTAQIDSSGTNVASMIVAWPKNDPKHYMAVQVRNTHLYGKNLSKLVNEILHYYNTVK